MIQNNTFSASRWRYVTSSANRLIQPTDQKRHWIIQSHWIILSIDSFKKTIIHDDKEGKLLDCIFKKKHSYEHLSWVNIFISDSK